MEENFEIDMLSVGAADAILIRYFNKEGTEYIVCIDAGNPEDGKKVVKHIEEYYDKDYIDLAISTHPDRDHIGGFDYILDHIEIKEFWIHAPQNHVNLEEVKMNINENLTFKRFTYIMESLNNSKSILQKIKDKNIYWREPFKGIKHDFIPLEVLGPDASFYEELLERFRDAKELKNEIELIEKNLLIEGKDSDILTDSDNDTTAENNSSAVVLFRPRDLKYLFTADAGPLALNEVKELYESETKDLDWLDVPHHGSKRSLTPDLVEHFSPKVAYVSAASHERFLSHAVINAFTFVETKVYSTIGGNNLWHHKGTENRDNYTTCDPINKDEL